MSRQLVLNKGFTLWFTGLPSSGKSSLARTVERIFRRDGIKVELLDGDVVRLNLGKGLGFSKEDREINVRRIGFVAHLLSRNTIVAVVSAVSPYSAVREANRQIIGDYVEVFVKASLEACEKRDVKGLYKKARAGEIPQFTGISDPYEEPLQPEVVCETEKETIEQSVEKVIFKLKELGYLREKVA